MVTLFFVSIPVIIYFISFGLKSKKNILFSLIGIDFTYLYDGTMWYISFIFIQYIIFYFTCLIFKVFHNKNIKHIFIIFFSFLINYIMLKLNNNYEIWRFSAGTHLYWFVFPLGILFGKLSNIDINKKIKDFICSVVAFISFIAVFCLYNRVYTINLKYAYEIFATAMPLLLIFIYELGSLNIKNNIVNYFGKNSYYIYLWEGFILLVKDQWFANFKYNILIDIVAIIVCLIISNFYKNIILKPITEIFQKYLNPSKTSN